MSDQLEEVERELYKHVGCKMFHSAGDAAHMLHLCVTVCVCLFLDAYVSLKCEYVFICAFKMLNYDKHKPKTSVMLNSLHVSMLCIPSTYIAHTPTAAYGSACA